MGLRIDPFGPQNRSELPHVVSVSGGRTSGRMLRALLDEGVQPIALFANTGKERDETLDFLREIERQWGVEIIWLQYCRVTTREEFLQHLKTDRMRNYARKNPTMHWFERVTYETAARHDDPWGPFDELLEWMNVLPNPRARACTAQLKIRTMQRYLWSQGIYSFVNSIGFCSDEWDRAADMIHAKDRDKDVGYRFPLAELDITKRDVDQWWASNEFDLGLSDYEGNCHLCFLKKRDVDQWWASNEFDLGLSDYEGNCHLCFLKKRAVKQRLICENPALTQ